MQQTVEDAICFMNEAILEQQNRMENSEFDYYTDEDRARFKANLNNS